MVNDRASSTALNQSPAEVKADEASLLLAKMISAQRNDSNSPRQFISNSLKALPDNVSRKEFLLQTRELLEPTTCELGYYLNYDLDAIKKYFSFDEILEILHSHQKELWLFLMAREDVPGHKMVEVNFVRLITKLKYLNCQYNSDSPDKLLIFISDLKLLECGNPENHCNNVEILKPLLKQFASEEKKEEKASSAYDAIMSSSLPSYLPRNTQNLLEHLRFEVNENPDLIAAISSSALIKMINPRTLWQPKALDAILKKLNDTQKMDFLLESNQLCNNFGDITYYSNLDIIIKHLSNPNHILMVLEKHSKEFERCVAQTERNLHIAGSSEFLNKLQIIKKMVALEKYIDNQLNRVDKPIGVNKRGSLLQIKNKIAFDANIEDLINEARDAAKEHTDTRFFKCTFFRNPQSNSAFREIFDDNNQLKPMKSQSSTQKQRITNFLTLRRP